MNLASLLSPAGRIDLERLIIEPPGASHAPIAVREWNSRVQRHSLVYEGCMRFAEVSRMGLHAEALPPASEWVG